MSQDSPVTIPIAKVSTAITGAVGAQVVEHTTQGTAMFSDLLVLNWTNIAGAMAALYSLTMFIDFCWRRYIRPAFERWNWIRPKKRHVYTAKEIAEVMSTLDTGQAPLR